MIKSKLSRSDLKKFIADWNNNFPMDKWWRIKYNVPFNSPMHREVSFLSQMFEYFEDRLYKQTTEAPKEDSSLFEEKFTYVPDAGDFLKPREGTEEDYDDLDLNFFDEND